MTKTMPLYDYYKDLGVLKTIKAYESKFDTFNEAVKVLEEKWLSVKILETVTTR